MRRLTHRLTSGFTLTEMAIVLAVVGVLAAGLWSILSGANTQIRDQATADQQVQLISAVKSFLEGPGGQSFMTANNGCALGADGKDPNGVNYCEPGKIFLLPLPATAACAVPGDFGGYADADDTANLPSWCTSLPPGFNKGTTNPYNQTFQIEVLRDASTPGKQPPASFSFMIVTIQTAGVSDTITDTSGARIASLIGGDGGFVYTNDVCNAQTGVGTTFSACGSFGGWNIATGTYGFGAAGGYSGSVATRSFVTPEQVLNNQWLARLPINGDTTFNQNSMTVPEYLGDNALVMGKYTGIYPSKDTTPTIWLGDYNSAAVPTTGGGTMEMQAGVINFNYLSPVAPGALKGTMNVQGGVINLNSPGFTAGGGTINMQGGLIQGIQGSEINLQTSPGGTPLTSPAYNSFMELATGCTSDMNASGLGTAYNASCVPALQITGDESVAGYLSAYVLYSATFIYDSSGKVSDARAKKDIVPIHNALDGIEKLKPVSYKLKTTGKGDMGFLAQDIEKVYPDLVMQNKNGYKAVDYEGLVAPLVGAVQELRRQNDDLRQQLKQQAVRQKKLENELQILKQDQ